jgi:peroxiredoxin
MNSALATRRGALLLAAALAGAAAHAAQETPAPDFTLKSRSGENVKLSELRGQVVLINFWASWCGPCRQEMPLLDQIYQQYGALGFTLLGVNVEQDTADAERMLKDTPVTFPILFDAENRVSRLYDVTAMPSTVLVDRDGKVRFVHRGYQPGHEDEYQAQIRALVRE